MNKKDLNEVLNIEDAVEVIKPTSSSDEEEIDREYLYTKSNLHTVIDRGTEALEEMLMIAKQSEQPRAFEVVSGLIKTIADANKDLLELKNKQKTLKGEKAAARVTNNALFVGSTAELQKMLKDARKDGSKQKG